MITSDSIIKSISKKLLISFPNIEVYKEAQSTPKYPHFFVNQINVQDEEERKNYHILTYSIVIRYRIKSDPSTDLSLQTDLDDMGFKLLYFFDLLDFNGSKVRCTNKSIEKVNGVLFFSFNIDLPVYNKSEIESIKMNKLKINMEER